MGTSTSRRRVTDNVATPLLAGSSSVSADVQILPLASIMDVSESTTTERTVTVNDVTFTVRELAGPLGWLHRGEADDELVDTSVMRRMEEADLVKKQTTGGFMSPSDNDPTTTWKPIGDKCKQLFDRLNEPYSKWRVKIEGYNKWGPWDGSETENAKEQAEAKLEELEERNPDVSFQLDEEELNSFPTQ